MKRSDLDQAIAIAFTEEELGSCLLSEGWHLQKKV